MRFITGIFLAVLVPSIAQATVVRAVSVAEMTKRADVIVEAQVEALTSAWNPERTRIYTVTRLKVSDSIKGAVTKGNVIKIRQIGGTADGITQMVAGNAKFAAGDRVIVFLNRSETENMHFVIGMAQGKFAISQQNGRLLIDRQMDGLKRVPTVAGQDRLADLPNVQKPGQTVLEFKARIRTMLNAPAP